MESFAPSTIVLHPSHHRNHPLRKLGARFTVINSAEHRKKNSKMVAKKKKMASYKQFSFVRSAFVSCKNVVSDVQATECGEQTIVPELHSGERKETGRLRSEQ